jgi:peptide/nickel transport system substrate-binding protein
VAGARRTVVYRRGAWPRIGEVAMLMMNRRMLLQSLGLGAASLDLLTHARWAYAAGKDEIIIGWPVDVPTWDPVERTIPDAQPIYKLVFDQPLDQAPDLSLVPKLVSKWRLADDALSMDLEFRDDVTFQDGSKMTSEDFHYTYIERVRAGEKIDVGAVWGHLKDVQIQSPTKAVMLFSAPVPTAGPWLAFLANYVVPKAYMTKVGIEGFRAKPIGSGPYKLAEYQMNSRIVLERNDNYWDRKPAVKRVIIEVIKDPSARVAAVQSGEVDLTIAVPIREIPRFKNNPSFTAEANPVTRSIMLYVRGDRGFAQKNVRLAAHHAIDKVALSKAFFLGYAKPLSVLSVPGSGGDVPGYHFAYDPELAKKLLAEVGYGPNKPARFKFGTTNGQFAGDYDLTRAIAQMWKKVGLEAEIEVIEYAKAFEMNRAGTFPEAVTFAWDNATGDPEIDIGYCLNPDLPFSAWKEKVIGEDVVKLFKEPNNAKRIAAYKKLNVDAVEYGAIIPLLQSIQTVVHRKNLEYTEYKNGWLLADKMHWQG